MENQDPAPLSPENADGSSSLDPRTGLPLRPDPVSPPTPPAPSEPAAAAPELPTETAASSGTTEQPLPGESEEDIRKELKQWNWGAFFLTWIWGIGNNTLMSLLALIPFVTFPMMFVLGFKGNAWAWKNKTWYSLAHFRDTQRRWAKWGSILGILFTLFFVGIFSSLVFGVTGMLKKQEPYLASLSLVQQNPGVQDALGSPIEPGFFVSGNAHFSGPDASVRMAYPIKGPKDSGTVYVQAFKEKGQWVYEWVGLEIGREKKEVDLTGLFAGSANQPAANIEETAGKVPAVPDGSSPMHTLRLKNGNEIQGRIVSEDEMQVTIEIPQAGSIVFSRNEILSIE